MDASRGTGHGHPVLAWAASGGMWLTGWPDEPPLAPAGPVIERALWAAAELTAAVARWGDLVAVDVGMVLFGRAALMGHARRGRVSANGSCRLLRARDGWLAINLARPDDVASVAALVGDEAAVRDPWVALESASAAEPAVAIAGRAFLLGVPAAVLPARATTEFADPPPWPARITPLGPPAPVAPRPLVVDLSSMWAGPLVARLLGLGGARVVKVESTGRLDGARYGHAGFWAWLHDGHDAIGLDLATTEGVTGLARMVASADVVIESSRPRALQQLGIVAEEVVAARPGMTWVSITGYGRDGDAGQRVAFGDDAAVAGGLVAYDQRDEPVFCGDAIADPLTGLVAAAAAAGVIADGGGRLVAVALADVAAWAAAGPPPPAYRTLLAGNDRWSVVAGGHAQEVLRPVAPELVTS